MSLRPIAKLVTSTRLVEGSGAVVYRSLGIFKLRYWDPILFLIISLSMVTRVSKHIHILDTKPSPMYYKEP